MVNNGTLLEWTKDITAAKMSNTNISPNKNGGNDVAEFMQTIYDKLVELNK